MFTTLLSLFSFLSVFVRKSRFCFQSNGATRAGRNRRSQSKPRPCAGASQTSRRNKPRAKTGLCRHLLPLPSAAELSRVEANRGLPSSRHWAASIKVSWVGTWPKSKITIDGVQGPLTPAVTKPRPTPTTPCFCYSIS